MERQAFADLWRNLVQATEAGRLADWTERIGQIARQIGLRVSAINWNACADDVALAVLREAKAYGLQDELAKAIQEFERHQRQAAVNPTDTRE